MRSIRSKLFFLLIIMGSIPLMIVLIVEASNNLDELEKATYREGRLKNSIVAEHLTSLCEKNFHVLHTLALNSTIKHYVENPLPEQRLRVAELLHNSNNIFNDRNIMALTGKNAIQLMRTDGSYLVNVITRQHFREAMNGRDYVSDIIVSMSTGKMIIVIEVPVVNSKGEPVGMLQRNLNLIELQHFVKSVDEKESSIIITDRDGRIIADSDKVFKSALEYIDDGSYKIISEKILEDANPFGIIPMTLNGQESLVSYSRNYITGWLIFVVKPYHYIWEEILFRVARSILLGFIMLTAIGILANKLSYKATKPIIDISQAATQIAQDKNSVQKIEFNSDDELSEMVSAFNKMRSLRDTYQIASELDKLTKLYNKATTENICKLKLNEFDKLDEPKSLMAFFVVDLDHFKKVNDTFGHQFGDKVLVEFSKNIRRIFRPNDCIGRFGGDEFIIIIENLPSVDIIIRKAESIKKIAEELTVDDMLAGVSASIGIAIVPPQGTDYEHLFKAADEELYFVKANGRNDYSMKYAEPVTKD